MHLPGKETDCKKHQAFHWGISTRLIASVSFLWHPLPVLITSLHQCRLIGQTYDLSSDTFAPSVVAARLAPDSNQLAHLLPEANRGIDESLFVRIDDWTFPHQVSLCWLDELSALDELPANEEDGCQNQPRGRTSVRVSGGNVIV